MSIGLSQRDLVGLNPELRQLVQVAPGTQASPAPYHEFREDFNDRGEFGPLYNTQKWSPNRSFDVPPAGSAHHYNSFDKIQDALRGADATSYLSYIQTLFAPITAAIGAGGLTLWGASGLLSRWFGGDSV